MNITREGGIGINVLETLDTQAQKGKRSMQCMRYEQRTRKRVIDINFTSTILFIVSFEHHT